MKSDPTYLNADGTIRLVEWAADVGFEPDRLRQFLLVDSGPRPTPMQHSNATGEAILTNGDLGVDLIRVAAGDGFAPHTHPGDHLLIVVAGQGTITYDGRIYPTRAGQAYMIEGSVAHAVGATTDHAILAVGAPHRPVDADDRMTPVDLGEVLAPLGDLTCLICNITARSPSVPADYGCPHCPSRHAALLP